MRRFALAERRSPPYGLRPLSERADELWARQLAPHRSPWESRQVVGPEGSTSAAAVAAVVGYIRVSSPTQDYAYQRHAIGVAAAAQGEAIDRWYADVASGSTMDRPELERLRAALEAREVRRVWVWRLDRLTRSGIADTLASVEHVRVCGAELVSVSDGVALDGGPAAELVLAVLAWCAQMERSKIRENQEAARARMAREGRPWGRPPLPPELKEAVFVLASQGKSVREIARELKVSKTWVGCKMAELGLKAAAKFA